MKKISNSCCLSFRIKCTDQLFVLSNCLPDALETTRKRNEYKVLYVCHFFNISFNFARKKLDSHSYLSNLSMY